MKVVILAGGFGTRLSEETALKPKPMVLIGTKPILWHIMKHYSQYGYNEFIVALGYKAEYVKEYFLKYNQLQGNIEIDLQNGTINKKEVKPENWKIHLIDTGLNTMTGGRVKRLESLLDNESFMLTYGDGVSNINIDKLVEFHKQESNIATISAVRPTARFGGIEFEGTNIVRFAEKSQIDVGWINGGYMVLEPGILSLLHKDEDVLEIKVLEALSREKKLGGYRHEGFWHCMDSQRDKNILQGLWDTNRAPWKIWAE